MEKHTKINIEKLFVNLVNFGVIREVSNVTHRALAHAVHESFEEIIKPRFESYRAMTSRAEPTNTDWDFAMMQAINHCSRYFAKDCPCKTQNSRKTEVQTEKQPIVVNIGAIHKGDLIIEEITKDSKEEFEKWFTDAMLRIIKDVKKDI